MFLETLAELFGGTEALFWDLEAYGRWDWGRRFPVIRLGFRGCLGQSRADVDRRSQGSRKPVIGLRACSPT